MVPLVEELDERMDLAGAGFVLEDPPVATEDIDPDLCLYLGGIHGGMHGGSDEYPNVTSLRVARTLFEGLDRITDQNGRSTISSKTCVEG